MRRRKWKGYVAGLVIGSMMAGVALPGVLAEEVQERLTVVSQEANSEMEETNIVSDVKEAGIGRL